MNNRLFQRHAVDADIEKAADGTAGEKYKTEYEVVYADQDNCLMARVLQTRCEHSAVLLMDFASLNRK